MSALNWRKSSFCNGASACVEVTDLPDGGVAVRDSKDPRGGALKFTKGEWRVFLAGVRDGQFDVEALHGSESRADAVMASGHQDDPTTPPEAATGAYAGIHGASGDGSNRRNEER